MVKWYLRENMTRKVLHTLKYILFEDRYACECIDIVQTVQWALNTVFRERYRSMPYHNIF